MSYPKEYADMVYLYMANDRLMSKEKGISAKRRLLLKSNNLIIKNNINKLYGENKFEEMYGAMSDGLELRDIKYTYKIGIDESLGERTMSDMLTFLNLPYVQEVLFNDLNFLRFDFYLPFNNAVIEVDGEQHKKYMPAYHASEDDFRKQKRYDNIKRKFAYKNNIIYIRFRYNELGNIKEKLKSNFVIK